MKQHDLYLKDLYDALTRKGIKTPNDFKLIKQSEINKIIRDIKVQRRRDIKDSNSMIRLETQLKKFEKLWKTKSKSRRHASAFCDIIK